MEGYKRANYHSINFQCRPGSPDLNCCSVNAPRAFGMMADWAYMTEDDGLIINYYGANEAQLVVNNRTVKIVQETNYPYNGDIRIRVQGISGDTGTLKLRIPFWSENNALKINGIPQETPLKCSYYTIRRIWNDEDVVELSLDMSFHYWAGEQRLQDRGSVYFGPLLLCCDPFYDPNIDFNMLPILDARTMRLVELDTDSYAGGLFRCTTADGGEITLCDLYTAGVSGTPYTSWLPVRYMKRNAFSKNDLTRSSRS